MQGLGVRPVANFYESSHYTPLHHRRVRRHPLTPNVRFSKRIPALRAELFSYFEQVSFERAGVLEGEYALIFGAEALICRDGTTLKPNVACENRWADAALDQYIRSADYAAIHDQILEDWDHLPVFPEVAVLSDPHRTSYYHFSLETLPRLRFMAERYPRFMLPSPYLSKPAIADLLRRTMGQRRLIPQTGAVKVVDPFLAHDLMSDDSICWLRANSHLHVGRGDRRVYIRRSAQTARSVRSGGISETAAFRRFLADYGFEILEFGDGELTAQEQVMKLDGCSIIISAHGAALTNLVYLDPPTTVIEIFGPYTSRPMYMHICATLGLNYYGVVSFECDAANDIIVDCDEMRDVMARIACHEPPRAIRA